MKRHDDIRLAIGAALFVFFIFAVTARAAEPTASLVPAITGTPAPVQLSDGGGISSEDFPPDTAVSPATGQPDADWLLLPVLLASGAVGLMVTLRRVRR